ncbi:MAG TPA: hypothetical protein VFM03_09230 [Candidatus Limnocylindria bacterium]|nr:hypothetical protein [Candidatus Limnocylindria bacterium]
MLGNPGGPCPTAADPSNTEVFMHRFRASHAATRLILALGLVLTLSTPVSAGGASIDVAVAVSSPQTVTVGHYVAYPVHVQNTGRNTLNTVSVSGSTPDGFTYVGSTPSWCSQSEAYCFLGQMPSGMVAPVVTFYFLVQGAPRAATFQASVSTAEGSNDNSDGTANNIDHWLADPILTSVVPYTQDFVSGHGLIGLNGFSDPSLTTGLAVAATNPHGTAVAVPSNAEVTIEDLPPNVAPPCPQGYGSCFGWASRLDVGTDDGDIAQDFPTGIVVTMVWDDSQLPKGMTARKLRVLHVTDAGVVELVNPSCTYDTVTGLPNNMPCFLTPPSKVGDKDIQAVMLWAHNGIGRGW